MCLMYAYVEVYFFFHLSLIDWFYSNFVTSFFSVRCHDLRLKKEKSSTFHNYNKHVIEEPHEEPHEETHEGPHESG